VNTPLQGTAADLIKLAMIRIDEEIRQRGLKSRMTLQVHDELVFEVPESEVDTMKPLVREHMEQAYSLAVPLLVEIGVGRTGGTWSKAACRGSKWCGPRLRKTIPAFLLQLSAILKSTTLASAAFVIDSSRMTGFSF